MIRVASFNVKNLSKKNIDDESQKMRDLGEIVKLVRNCDIVVLQEVLDREVVSSLSKAFNASPILRLLGRDWRGEWVSTQANSKYNPYPGDCRNEGYAFLWNTRKVELANENGKEIRPKTYSHYTVGTKTNKMLRYPGYGRFLLRNRIRPVEIRVITAHIAFGKPKIKDGIEIPDVKEIENRKREFDILSGWIYKNINDQCKSTTKNEIITIIVGDYNLNLKGSGLSTAVIKSENAYYPSGNAFFGYYDINDYFGINVMRTVQSKPTTINQDCTGYASNYDHCTYNVKVAEAIKSCYRKDAISGKTPEEIKEYHDTVSDHVPIVVEINC